MLGIYWVHSDTWCMLPQGAQVSEKSSSQFFGIVWGISDIRYYCGAKPCLDQVACGMVL